MPEPTPNRNALTENPIPVPRARRWLHVLLVVIGGIFQCLGFAGWSLWPFALVSFVPMMWVLEQEKNASTRRVLALGLIHGSVGYTGGYYWLVNMLENFSGYEGVVNWAFASVFFVYQGGQQMLIYWLYRRMRRRGFGATLSAVPALLTLEMLYPVLFPAFLATGFHDATVLIQVADLGGPMLVSGAAMAVNGAVFEVLYWLQDRTRLKFPAYPVALVVLSSLFVIGYGLYRIDEVETRMASAPTKNVGLVQVDMGIFAKREDPFEGHRRHLEQSEALIAQESLDLLVWPESAYTFFLPDDTSNLKDLVLGSIDVPTLFGGLAIRTVEGRSRQYNTAYLLDGDGEILGTYDKTFLLAFGEYLPFGEDFPSLYDWSPNTGRFTPGSHVHPLLIDDLRITTLICYEDVLPGFTRNAVAEADPNLLVNITNDAWFGDTHEPWIHLALAKFRAVEHHRALVRSTNSGVSALIDPLGRNMATIPFGVRDEIAASMPLLDTPTAYQTLGDWPAWLALVATFFMAFFFKPSHPSPKSPAPVPASAPAESPTPTVPPEPSKRTTTSHEEDE